MIKKTTLAEFAAARMIYRLLSLPSFRFPSLACLAEARSLLQAGRRALLTRGQFLRRAVLTGRNSPFSHLFFEFENKED